MTALTAQQTFEERMKERIRDSIGELMPDAALAEIVKRATEQAFFKPRELERRDAYYGGRPETKEPWITEFVRGELSKQVGEAVKAWMKENDARIQEAVNAALGENIMDTLASAVRQTFSGAFYTFGENIRSTLQQLGRS